jgi:hypothetical protein
MKNTTPLESLRRRKDKKMGINIDECRRLWLAVVEQGVDDVRGHLAGQSLIEDPHRLEGAKALRWFKLPDFEKICGWAGLAPDAVRRAALKDQTP